MFAHGPCILDALTAHGIVAVYLVKVIKDFLVGLPPLGATSLLLSKESIKQDALYLSNNVANLSIFYRKKVGALG